MALALDTHGSGNPTSVTTITTSVTVANNGSTIVVGVGGFTNTFVAVSNVKYNGVAFTQLDSVVNPAGNPGAVNYTFILQNVAAQTANLVITYASTQSFTDYTYAVLSGAATTGQPDNHGVSASVTFTGGTASKSITSNASNCFVFGYADTYVGSDTISASGANQTQLDNPGGASVSAYTQTAVSGSNTFSYTTGSGDVGDIFLVSIAPAPTPSSVSELTMLGVG